MTWTDPRTWNIGEKVRAAHLNAQLRDNLLFLYDAPKVTLRRTDDQTGIAPNEHTTIVWQEAVVDQGGWWDPGSPEVAVYPRDGWYGVITNLLWDHPEGGTFRQARFLHDGDPARGTSPGGGGPFIEHALPMFTSVVQGTALSVDVRHNHSGTDRAILGRQTPLPRSPLLMAMWLGPLHTAF